MHPVNRNVFLYYCSKKIVHTVIFDPDSVTCIEKQNTHMKVINTGTKVARPIVISTKLNTQKVLLLAVYTHIK
jgi:hypothetical protein